MKIAIFANIQQIELLSNQLGKLYALLHDKTQFEKNSSNLDAKSKTKFKKTIEWFDKAYVTFQNAFGFNFIKDKATIKLDYFGSIRNLWTTLIKTIENTSKWNYLEDYIEEKGKHDELIDAYNLILKTDEWIEKNSIFNNSNDHSISFHQKLAQELTNKINKIRNSKSKVKIVDRVELKSNKILEWTVSNSITIHVYSKEKYPSISKAINSIKSSRFSPAIFCVNEIGSGLWSKKDKVDEKVTKHIFKLWSKHIDKNRLDFEKNKDKDTNHFSIWVTTFEINKPGTKTTWTKSGNEIELKLALDAYKTLRDIEDAEDPDNPDKDKLQIKLKALYYKLEKINQEL